MTEISSCTNNVFTERCGVNVFISPGQQLGTDDDCVLILGQIHPDGTAAPGLYQYDANQAPTQFGPNGTLMQSIEEFLDGCPTADIWIYAAADPGATAGSAEIEILDVDTATAAGTIYVWVNGQVYSVPFDPAATPTPDTNAIVADRLAALIAADNPYLTVTSSGGVVSIETTETGEVAGFLDVRTSYACRQDLVTSPEVTVNVTMTPGNGVPDFSGLPGIPHGCEFVDNPYTDTATMGHVAQYLCSQWSGGASSRAYGVYYGTALQAAAFGLQTNSPFFSYMAAQGALTPPYLESASYTCIAYRNLNCQADSIAASISDEVMPSMLAPEPNDLFTGPEQADLIENGMGYFNVNRAKDVIIGRAVTTYTVADNGTLDNSFRDVNKPAIYACLSRNLRENITSKFSGYLLRTDGVVGTRRGSNRVTTVEGVENCILNLAQEWSDNNWIQDIPGFIQSLEVTIDPETGCISIFTDPDVPCPVCCWNVYLGAA